MNKTLAEMSWVEAEQALGNTDLALVPVGAVEVYGPHLPQGSDGYAALEVAKRLAERVGAVVTPLVPIGCSQSLMSFPGTLTVSPEALKLYLADVCNSLVKWQIKRILFVNGHAGNVPIISQIAFDLQPKGIKCAQVDWWRAVAKVAADVSDTGPSAIGHAAENCTCVMMAVRGDLVDRSKMVKEMKPNFGLIAKYPEVMQYAPPYREIAPAGINGDPTTATGEKGERIIAKFLDRAVAFLQEWR
jgi:creatinine amidohydrolase